MFTEKLRCADILSLKLTVLRGLMTAIQVQKILFRPDDFLCSFVEAAFSGKQAVTTEFFQNAKILETFFIFPLIFLTQSPK